MFCWDSDIETRPLVPRLRAVFTKGPMLINHPQKRFCRPLASSLSQLHSSARFYGTAPSGVSCDNAISLVLRTMKGVACHIILRDPQAP